MRVRRIIRTRMVHVMVCIISVISVIAIGEYDVSKFVRMRLRVAR